MTPVQAAHLLGVHETAVRTVEDRESDSVVTLRDGTRMLVSATTARAYVSEVDDVCEDESDDGAELDEPKPKMAESTRRTVKRTPGKAA